MTDSLLQVMSIFNFASDGFANHPLRKPEFYNDITEALCKAIDHPISYAAGKINSVTNVRVGMPFYMSAPTIESRDIIEIEMHNPFKYIYATTPSGIINVSTRIPYHVIECRGLIKTKDYRSLLANWDSIINNMKVYYNLFYGRINATNSIIRTIGDINVFEYFSNKMLMLIDKCVCGIPHRDVLYYDTDTIYIRNTPEHMAALHQNITHMLDMGVTVSYDVYDNLIIPSKKNIIKFDGDPKRLCISTSHHDPLM